MKVSKDDAAAGAEAAAPSAARTTRGVCSGLDSAEKHCASAGCPRARSTKRWRETEEAGGAVGSVGDGGDTPSSCAKKTASQSASTSAGGGGCL